jgi:hypothetical protein
MEVPAHVLDGWIEDVALEIPNPLVEAEFTSMFQVEGAWNFTPPTNNTKGLNKSTNNNIRTFRQIALPKGLNSTKK